MLLQENPAIVYPVQYGGVFAQPKPKVRTKKAWVNYFKRHRDMCIYVVPSSASQFWDDEIHINPKQWVKMLLEDKSLVPCKSKKEVQNT